MQSDETPSFRVPLVHPPGCLPLVSGRQKKGEPMTYSESLYAAQDAALARACNASLEPPDDYYFDLSPNEDEPEEDQP